MTNPLLGFVIPNAGDVETYYGVPNLPIMGVSDWGGAPSWALGMWSIYSWTLAAGAGAMLVTVDPLVGTGTPGSGIATSPQGPADSTYGNGTAATLTITAGSGSAFTFSYNGGAASSSPFAYNSNAAAIQTALNSTAGVSGATVTASGTAHTFLLTFPLASAITPSLLTTGSSSSFSVATTHGTQTTNGSYTVLTCLQSDTLVCTGTATGATALIVAGGGSGGEAYYGGGGGAGQVLAETGITLTGSMPVVVGAGGAQVTTTGTTGNVGNASTFAGYSAAAGNGGLAGPSSTQGGSGGASGSGKAGGTGPASDYAGGGGGGDSAVGVNATGSNIGGIGGAGTSSSITGSAVTYGGGGGGAGFSGSGAGGAGGGGAGSSGGGASGTAGTANTGGGGGGTDLTSGHSGAGGSGIVIVSWLTGSGTAAGTITAGATMTLADVAAGIWDAMYTPMFTTIKAAGISNGNSLVILRIGGEMFGEWEIWGGSTCTAAMTAVFQHLVTLARTVSSSFKFDWNGAMKWQSYDPMTATGGYPGDSYVDYISCDYYDGLAFNDVPSSGHISGAADWAYFVANYAAEGMAFAETHGKPYCLTEWGLGQATYSSGVEDDPAWIEAAYYWMRANASALGYCIYMMDEESSNPPCLQYNPNSGAVFASLFTPWAQQLAGATTYRFVTSGTNRLRIT